MIKLLVPDMPTADDLLPYLRRIDAARVYVNNGPLVQELQARLEQMTGAHVALVSNGTVALELALKALDLPETHEEERDGYLFASYVAIPALTFSATGLSVMKNRITPLLCDVDDERWQLQSYLAAERHSKLEPHQCNRANSPLVAAMPVATFGAPVDVKQWEGYSVPVVIDAAGAFPQQQVSRDPNISTCFSLHATKFIGCGEGGFVASANKALIERVRSLAAFGEDGTNAKMSEYHAAVALASLDRMKEKIARFRRMMMLYYHHGVGLDLRFGGNTILNVLLPVPASQLIPRLLDDGIETKQWYRPYLDERAEFAVPRGTFPITDHLREHLLGIPFHNFMTEADVAHVCSTLKNILRKN